MRQSKLYKEKVALIDKEKSYNPKDAMELLKKIIPNKFDESIEVHFNLGIDPRHADQQLRGTFALPNGTGKSKKILAIVEGEQEKEANEAGADFVGCDEYIEKIQGGWFDFDIIITSPSMMKKLGRLGKTLGSKGLMPNPKAGTVTQKIGETIKEFKSGKFEYRNDKNGLLHIIIGKASFDSDALYENFEVFFDLLQKIKPSKAKGTYIKSIALCSTQSPSILIEPMKVKW
ncbi:50S ribosomal protein L1 [Candidatus Marinamargulisbacteria bacterium SCGC AG-414-C22]|nr:50S ribosomal protein L1 [Candidatus Marinamargulisbacteria bacterium SCGC AG-414-C22]